MAYHNGTLEEITQENGDPALKDAIAKALSDSGFKGPQYDYYKPTSGGVFDGHTVDPSPGNNQLVINLSGDQYQGNPKFEVYVDGKLVSGELSGGNAADGVTADHSKGEYQSYTVTGNFDPSVAHTVEVKFTNDQYGGSDATDRNLYVGKVTLDGQPVGTSSDAAPSPLYYGDSSVSQTSSGGPGSDKLVVNLSGDQYQGNPHFEVYVDGKLVSGELSGGNAADGVTADHSKGEFQSYTVTGNFDPSVAHTVEVKFTDDLYGGSDATDRNLYVGDVTLNGQPVGTSSDAAPSALYYDDSSVSSTSTPTASSDIFDTNDQVFIANQAGETYVIDPASTLVVTTGVDDVTVLLKGSEDVRVIVGSGGAHVEGNAGFNTLQGGTGDDFLSAGSLGGNHLIYSGGGHDTLYGGSGADTLYGGSGDSELHAGSGANVLYSGAGHDTLFGGGASELHGVGGGDTLYGGMSSTAHDTLIAGSGSGDLLQVYNGDNMLRGGSGFDTLMGGAGHDTLVGGGHSDMFAGSGGSTLFGGYSSTASDTLHGGSGNDILKVFQGDNALYAQGGSDTLYSGIGNDTLYGSSGNDTFVVDVLQGNDTIIGGGGMDTLHIDSHMGSDAMYALNGDGSTTITFGAGATQSITVSGDVSIQFGDGTGHKIG